MPCVYQPGLADATSIYSVFAAYSLRASASNEPSDASEFVPTLTQLLASPTPSIADDVVAAIKQISGASSAQDTDTAVEIDWSGQGDDTGVDIDWNLDMAPAAGGGEAVEEPAGGEIDWSAMIAADTVGDAGGADGGIVWDITETEPSSTTANGVDAAAALQGSGSEVASNQYGGLPVRSEPVDGSELLDLLQDEFRDRLLDDLEELSTFFSQRSIEIGRQSASGTFLVSASDAPGTVYTCIDLYLCTHTHLKCSHPPIVYSPPSTPAHSMVARPYGDSTPAPVTPCVMPLAPSAL